LPTLTSWPVSRCPLMNSPVLAGLLMFFGYNYLFLWLGDRRGRERGDGLSVCAGAPTDIWELTKGMLQNIYFLLLITTPCLVKQNVGWCAQRAAHFSELGLSLILIAGTHDVLLLARESERC
jgi:hypothetical protein